MFANPQLEQMAPDELHALQLQRLKKTVAWAYEKSGIYKRKFDAASVKPVETLSIGVVKLEGSSKSMISTMLTKKSVVAILPNTLEAGTSLIFP